MTLGLRIANAQAVVAGDSPLTPRLRLVPQSSDTTLADILESKDGTRLVTHDRRYAPRLWDAKTLKLLCTLGGANSPVTAVYFSPDGKQILTKGTKEIQLWDSLRAKKIWTVPVVDKEKEEITAATFSPDGKKIAFTSRYGIVRVLSTNNPRDIKELKGLTIWTNSICFAGNDKVVAGGEDQMAIAWNANTGEKLYEIPIGDKFVRWINADSAGKTVLVTTLSGEAIAVDGRTGKLLYTKPHSIGSRSEELLTDMAAKFVNSDEGQIVCAAEDGTLNIYHARTGELVRSLKGHIYAVREIRVSANGERIATYGDDEKMILWETDKPEANFFDPKNGDPTAGTFSSDSNGWWLGYGSGNIRRFDLRNESVRGEQLGGTVPLNSVRFFGSDRLQLWGERTYSEPSLTSLQESRFIQLGERGAEPSFALGQSRVSDLGRYAFTVRGQGFSTTGSLTVADLLTGKNIIGPTDLFVMGAFWIKGTHDIVIQETENKFTWLNVSNGQVKGTWSHKVESGIIAGGDGGSKIVITDGSLAGFIFDVEADKLVSNLEFPTNQNFVSKYFFTPDGKKLVSGGAANNLVWDVATGKILMNEARKDQFDSSYICTFSPDSRFAYQADGTNLNVIDLVAMKTVKILPWGYSSQDQFPSMFTVDRKRVLSPLENVVRVTNTETGEVEFEIQLSDFTQSAIFSPDGKRIVTQDSVNGLVIWDAQPKTITVDGKPKKVGRKIGSVVQALDGTLLVMDEAGRYDAADPSNVTAAMYVMEWEGGFETIEVSQFKSIFWDPGLLQKLLGLSKEPLRDVPDLSELRLFPTVSIKPSGKSRIDIGLKARDNGGIGKVQVFLNNKLVEEKLGTGYFTMDLEKLKPMMWPENLLPKGKGNILGVKVSNEKGDLTSNLETYDVGVPTDLKVPEIKLYALFCGVSDYVGTGDDLGAPASDAEKLEEAIKETSGKLLEARTFTTLFTTKSKDAATRPTRANIMKWLSDVGAKATSSDIVLIFFAGHGIDKLGEKSGYFFLTSEAQPSEVTEASLGNVSISGEDLKAMLGKIAASKQVVLLDTCHSGAAAADLVGESRSISGDYARAFESIKDANGTWMLAGSAADQRSYESVNVDHGMLTYALLEAIDRGNAAGLRQAPSGELFVDVERWLQYAAARVESLKNEVGLAGLQRPEFKRSKAATTFDLGVMDESNRGFLGLKAPKPVVILGSFQMEEEDPAGIEDVVKASFKDSTKIKAWFDASKHPNVYRVAGNYTTSGDSIEIKIFLQKFDSTGQRKTLETFTVKGTTKSLSALGSTVLSEVEKRITALEEAKSATP
jgi:WD40 repeat protein